MFCSNKEVKRIRIMGERMRKGFELKRRSDLTNGTNMKKVWLCNFALLKEQKLHPATRKDLWARQVQKWQPLPFCPYHGQLGGDRRRLKLLLAALEGFHSKEGEGSTKNVMAFEVDFFVFSNMVCFVVFVWVP